jgi:hypothetical protein
MGDQEENLDVHVWQYPLQHVRDTGWEDVNCTCLRQDRVQ